MTWDDTLEIFYAELLEQKPDTCFWGFDNHVPMDEGWFYWFSFPGCLPDSGPIGPFKTVNEARKDAETYYGDEEEKL